MTDVFPLAIGKAGLLRARLEPHADCMLLALAGEFDLASTPAADGLLAQLQASGPVRVDLRALTFLDSSAAAVLVAAHRRSSGPVDLEFLAGGVVGRTLTRMGLDQVLDMIVTEQMEIPGTGRPALRGLPGPGDRGEPARFVVTTRVINTPGRFDRLDRAVARLREFGDGSVRWVEILEAETGLAVRLDLEGRSRSARAEAERVFIALWYDAFGDRRVGYTVLPLDTPRTEAGGGEQLASAG